MYCCTGWADEICRLLARAIFGAIDSNKDGVISQEDLHVIVRESGLDLSDQDISVLWKNADTDSNGFLVLLCLHSDKED